MLRRTRWRVTEEACTPPQATARWAEARKAGADGAVTSWGAGIHGRQTLRLYWEFRDDRALPAGEDLAEENWTPFWRESLSPVAVTDRIALVPAWEEPPAGVACPLRIDPGMAFGAGDHPTTRLCLRLLEDLAAAGALPARVLDVGAGTGVLALAAACLGAAAVDALDIDPFGYAACRRNAALNGWEREIRPLLLSLDLLEGRYPLLLVNMVGAQIAALAAELRRHLEPGGRMVLSGFETHRAEAVLHAVGLPAEERREEDGWSALLVRGEQPPRAGT